MRVLVILVVVVVAILPEDGGADATLASTPR
jgi:hypothetical protein